MDEIKEKELDPIEVKPEEPTSMQGRLLRMALGYDDLMPINLTKHISVATIQGKEAASIVKREAGADTLKLFSDDKYPVAALTVSILRAQDGTGDPTPTNIRAFIGYDDIEIYQSGADTTDYETVEYSLGDGGPYYVGAVDPVTGKLTVTHELWTVTGGFSGYLAGTNGSVFSLEIPSKYQDKQVTGSVNYFCNMFKGALVASNTLAAYGFVSYTGSKRYLQFCVPADVAASNAGMNTWAAGLETPITICAPLKTPVEVDLDPETFTLLKGENNFWADCGPVEELTY